MMRLLRALSSPFLQLMKNSLVAAARRRQSGWRSRFAGPVCFPSAVILVSVLLTSPPIAAQEAQPSEYQIKAAFIFNFAKFVEWPATAFAEATSPLCIGVIGENPFGTDLERFVRDKRINDHPLTMRECRTLEEAKKCHIVFISSSEKKRLQEILKALQGANVLTVSETEGFTENGGIVNFVSEGKKIRFQINDGSAKSAGLKISSKLLSLASPRRASADLKWKVAQIFRVGIASDGYLRWVFGRPPLPMSRLPSISVGVTSIERWKHPEVNFSHWVPI